MHVATFQCGILPSLTPHPYIKAGPSKKVRRGTVPAPDLHALEKISFILLSSVHRVKLSEKLR